MKTQKMAITIPSDLVAIIDNMSKKQKVSRSKFISTALREKLMEENERQLRNSYDSIFSDQEISKEQLETAKWFGGSGSKAGQEW